MSGILGAMCDDPAEAYRRALRAWHVALMERVEQHRAMFLPIDERDRSLVYAESVELIEELRAAESRAWDRFLRARDIYAQHLASGGSA